MSDVELVEQLDKILNKFDYLQFKKELIKNDIFFEDETNALIEKLQNLTQQIRKSVTFQRFSEILNDENIFLDNDDIILSILPEEEFDEINII